MYTSLPLFPSPTLNTSTSFPPSLPLCLPPLLLPPSFPPCLPLSLPPSLPPSLPASLPPCLRPSLLPPSLPPSLSPSLPPCPQKLRSSRSKRWCWWSTLLLLTLLNIIFISVPLGLWSDKRKEECFDYESDDESSEKYPFLFLPDRGEFMLCEKGKTQLKGSLGKHHGYIKEERVNVYTYSEDTVLKITRLDDNDNCLWMEWTGISSAEKPLVDCFAMKDDLDLRDLEWFGAHELYTQKWPLKDTQLNMTPFLPQDYLAPTLYQSRNTFGPVLHPLWLASNGVGILVDQVTPLSVSINQNDDERVMPPGCSLLTRVHTKILRTNKTQLHNLHSRHDWRNGEVFLRQAHRQAKRCACT